MSKGLKFPHEPQGAPMWRFLAATTRLRWVWPAMAALLAAIFLLIALWLFGTWTPQWIPVEDVDAVLVEEDWPEMPETVAPAIFGDDRDPATLSVSDLRQTLSRIAMNTALVANGDAPLEIAGPAPDATGKAGSPGLQAYRDWTLSSACSLSGWRADARPYVAAMIRNGVWGCSDTDRALAAWPLAILFGTALGLLLSLVILGGMAVCLFFVGKGLLERRALHAANRIHFGSWAA